MSIDGSAPCPGGGNKKIKFCCPDLVGELRKIERMLEGEQNLACLGYIERLGAEHPGRACLLAIKGLVLRALGRWEEATANAAVFVEKHPQNPVALAEWAICAAAGDRAVEAAGAVHRAVAACEGQIKSQVYEAMRTVAQALLAEGQWLAGRALLRLQTAIDDEDDEPAGMLAAVNRTEGVPLLLKDETRGESCPPDAPWKDRYEESMQPLTNGDWRLAAERLAELAEEVPDEPVIWRTIAILRGRLADLDGCKGALRRLAALDVPLEDAVEAEALAMLLAEIPLGDPLDILSVTWTVNDAEVLQAALTLDGRVMEVRLGPSAAGEEDSPPPRAVYAVFDRAMPEEGEQPTPQTASWMVGQAMLFGRQTDREARLEVVGVTRERIGQLGELLSEIAGDAFDGDTAEERVIGQVSASEQLLQRNWRLPGWTTAERLDALAAEHIRDALLNRWPQLELGVLDGKSASQAAGEESYRVRLLAAVMVLESWAESESGEFDFNLLREQLGLPVLEPIDPGEVELGSLPLVRLSRVMTERASDEALCLGYRRAMGYGANAILERFARAIVDREGLSGRPEQLLSLRTLTEAERNPEKALEYLERGRSAAESAGMSSAPWDLMELPLRMARREGTHLGRLLEHIQQEHVEEPGVLEALTQFLVSVGVIRPDGTPAAGPSVREESPVTAAGTGGRPQGLWTPDGDRPGGEKKIWTPD